MTPLKMCKFNRKFITEVIVKGGVVLDYIILRDYTFYVLFCDCFYFFFLHTQEQNMRKTSEYNAVQYNRM